VLLGNLSIVAIIRSPYMSKYPSKALIITGLGLSVSGTMIPTVARSEKTKLPDPNVINKKIKQDYPPELFDDPNYTNSTTETPGSATGIEIDTPGSKSSTGSTTSTKKVVISEDGKTAALGNTNFTFVLPTPAVIALVVIVGGLALFPVVSLLLNSKKALKTDRNSFLAKLTDRFQKPRTLESDEFLHQRAFEKLTAIAGKAENIHAEKFGGAEFATFVKIKSYVARAIGEYAGLDDSIEMLHVAISTQNSFTVIDGSESRHCSSAQQELYKFVNGLLAEEIDSADFKKKIEQKLQEVIPLLKTEEGKVALQTYTKEMGKISEHPLGLKLLLLFKQYQFDDYSILRGVSNTIAQLGQEDLLNLDGLLLLVMTKYDVFEKLGPIIGITGEYNRPETYSKMLQYIGLKAGHEASYGKFQEFLLLIKEWGIHYTTIVNVRQKYNPKEFRLSKNFTGTVPGEELYKKYKDSLQHIESIPQSGGYANEPTNSTAPKSTPAEKVVDPKAEVLVGMN
jgi:hypothetical protein